MQEATIQIHPMSKFLRTERIPHIWCYGCGLGSITNALCRSLVRVDANLDEYVITGGIGCTGRATGYLNIDGFHTTHGRAIAVATGIKVANPKLHVIVFSGDGDLFAIGGNHFFHAARRNVDMLVLCANNFIYGLTGGQLAPTTPLGAWTQTTANGNYEPPVNMCGFAAASGATYVARSTVAHIEMLEDQITTALRKKGFSFIEVISNCHEEFGRFNDFTDPMAMVKFYTEHARVREGMDAQQAGPGSGDEDGYFNIGTFLSIERPTYTDRVRVVRA